MEAERKDAEEIATRFVMFVQGCTHWDDLNVLTDDIKSIIMNVLAGAGFEVSNVSVDVLRVHDYSRQSRTAPVNVSCPFKAAREEGKDHLVATSWLNQLWERASIRYLPYEYDTKVVELIERVRTEIVRSRPLPPIPIGPNGEFLLEYPPENIGFFVDHSNDKRNATGCVGVHKYCESWVDRKRISKTHDALVCRGCGLRVTFPREFVQWDERREVKTYGDLRIVMAMLARQNWQWR